MSWLYSRALVGAYSAATFSGGEQSAPSKATPTPLAYCAPAKMTDFSRLSRSGTTFAPLTASRGRDLLTWCQGGFRAPIYPQRERAPASKANSRDSGPKWPVSLAKYDPATRGWRTVQCSLLEALGEYAETWPRWGSMRNGEFWARTMPVQITSGIESGSWPTPRAQDSKHAAATEWELATDHAGTEASLRVQVVKRMWPTPQARDGKNPRSAEAIARRGGGFRQLADVVTGGYGSAKTWPTPTTQDASNNGGASQMERNSLPLNAQAGGSLNPTWVAWLMGWPIGWTDLDASAMAKCPKQWP
jgi:hypothetical protein